MKKWIRRMATALALLALLLFSAAFSLLGTETGTQLLVAQAQRQLDGRLHIGSSRGKLLGQIELTDILFDTPAGQVKLGRLLLDWKPADLLQLHLHILELTADDISYDAASGPPPAEAEESGPLLLPELDLPITISIEKLGLHNVVFHSAADSEPVTIDEAALALSWDRDGIHLQELRIVMAEASLAVQGWLSPTGSYPLQLTTDLETLSPDLPSLKLIGEYGGDLQELVIREELSGDISAELDMRVLQPVNAVSWQGQLEIKGLPPALFSPEIAGILTGSLQSDGNLQQAHVTAALHLRDDTAAELNWDAKLDAQADLQTMLITIKQLELKHAETQARIDLGGSIDPDGPLDLALRWQELQWPLTGDAEYSSGVGEAVLTGSMDAYHLVISAEVAGSDLPEANLKLSTDGNMERLENLECSTDILAGTVGLRGRLQWAPVVSWQLSAHAEEINPGLLDAEWPGRLGGLIHSQGSLQEDGVVAEVTLERMGGSLRQLPVAGRGQIDVTPDMLHIEGLQLSSGSALLTGRGTLGDDSAVEWKAEIADFSDLLPGSSGQLTATGTVRGKMDKPRLSLQLSAAAIGLPQLKLEQIQADAELDLGWQNPFHFELSATGLQSGENLLDHFSLRGRGTREEHDAQLLARHELAEISLDLSGSYLQEQWQGVLNRFTIDSTDLGSWQLREAAKLNASATAASLERICLHRETADICAHGSWDSKQTNTGGELQVSEFPLTWLSPWFPETLDNVDGLFSLTAAAKMEKKLAADLQASISPGTISYLTDKEQKELPHQGMKLMLHAADDALNGEFSLTIDSNTISGNLQSPDLLQSGVGGKAGLSGRLLIDAGKFDLLEALVPQIQDLDATAQMDFSVEGTLEQPEVKGRGKIDIPAVSIPAAGLDLTDTTLNIAADNREVTLKGRFTSPSGSMELDGRALLDSAQKWPARCTLKSDNFRLINLPDIRVFLSSDLLLEKENGLISLSGSATIPRAEILLRELPAGTQTASPDVVIIQEEKEEKTTSPLKMDLKVTLGNDVHFAGLGMNAFIDGQLTMQAEPEEQLLGSGAFHIKQGSYQAFGQDLEIQTGVISFPGGPLTQPGINLRATRTIGNIVAGVSVIGPARKPKITTFSNPPMSESQTLSYLLTGSAPDSVGSGAKLSIGRQINNKLSIAVGTDVKSGDNEFITRYRLNRKIHVQITTATNSNAADIFYTVELGGEKQEEE